MASSEVGIASSSPFGCVLRDRNHRDGCRESNVKATHAALQRNIKNFVIDHINTCMSMSSDSPSNENENNVGSWVSNASNNNNSNNESNNSSSRNNRIENIRLKRISHVNNKDETSLASLISPRHSRLLDRWAARQAQAVVSTLENEVEILSIHNNSSSSSMLRRTGSSTSDDTSSGVSNLGASSLVQIWEKRFNGGKGSKPNTPVANGNGRTSPNSAAAGSTSNNGDNAALSSEAGESCYLPAQEEKDLSCDWESNSDQSISPQGRWSSSEAVDGDRVCVADIIKRLTSPHPCQSPIRALGDDNDEGCSSTVTSSPSRDCASVTCPPRFRGRHAFNDLLMQLERDRHGELNHLAERRAVSKFTHTGRIQSLLRLKLLQRSSMGANDQAADQSHQKSTLSTKENKQQQESAIMQLREMFSFAVEHKTMVQTEVTCSRSSHTEIVSNAIPLDDFSATNQPSKDTTHSQTVPGTTITTTESIKISMPQSNGDHNKEKAHVTIQETCLEVQHDSSQETAKATPSMTDSDIKEIANKEEASQKQYAVTETTYEETVQEEDAREQQYDDILEEAVDHNCDEIISYDWISEISRPKSYWEERRQAWYREMLATDSQNEDIRTLLERRTVSTFLSGNFRGTMDKLMHSHRGTQTQLVNWQDDDGVKEGLKAILQERLRSARTQEDGRVDKEEGDERRNEEEEEEEDADEVVDYCRQTSSPRSWGYRDNEAGEDFDRTASITSSQPSQSQSFCQSDRPYSSSTNRNSIEMELIYDLRGQMEQLYHEMSELRKSIKSCMDMQMQMHLQQSMNQESHTVKKEEKKSHNQAPKKGNCCICYEMKVDSVLYRCGHMCACIKCANELQWKGGKCPICRAKIIDAVQVFVDN